MITINEKRIDPDYMEKFTTEIHEWSDKTFGEGRTAMSVVHHLGEEVQEVLSAIETYNEDPCLETWEEAGKEFADCFILILNASSKFGLTFGQLYNTAVAKMVINRNRKWNKPDENGICCHVK